MRRGFAAVLVQSSPESSPVFPSGPLLKLTNFSFAYTQLTIILKNHFASKKMVQVTERYRFLNCTQREGQSVTALAAANLKHLAATCQFGNHLNEALCDRFVCGLRSKETKETANRGTHLRCSTEGRPPSTPKLPKKMLLHSRTMLQLLSTMWTLVIVDVFSLHSVWRVLASKASSIPPAATPKTNRCL